MRSTHKPTLMRSTHKPTLMRSTHKPTLMRSTHKPTLMRSTHKPTLMRSTQADRGAKRAPLAIVRLMLTRVDMTMDAADPDRLAEFWKAAVGYVDEPAPAPFADRREWLRSFGEEIREDGPIGAAWLVDPNGIAPRLSILPVPEPKTAKNRLHLDLRVTAGTSPGERGPVLRAEVDRLVAAGASVLWSMDDHHVTLADPEGNEFCIA